MLYLLIATDEDKFGYPQLHTTELSAENIVDIRSAMTHCKSCKGKRNGECFGETLEKIQEVPVPMFDY